MLNLNDYDELSYYVIELLKLHGLRVSEVLEIQVNDRIKNDLFLVRAKKNGVNLKIQIPDYERILRLSNGKKGYLFGGISRFKIYQVCKKYGYILKKENNINKAVTHSFRHNFANDINKMFNDVEVNKNLLNHKSKKSQLHYLKK